MVEKIKDLMNEFPLYQWVNDIEALDRYASDYTEDFVFPPHAVLIPNDVDEIAAVLKYCNLHQIHVTTRGAGTGLSGAALPVLGGLVISTERLNHIINIDYNNLTATVEPGVINAELKKAVSELGLYYPPDPASMGSSTIGGNVAHSAGGPKAVKYGITRDYILNLEVVLSSGEIIWTGANTLKNSTGFNLTQLFIGSEGLLGIITKIVVKLVPLPTQELLLLAAFENNYDCAIAVNKIMASSVKPAAIEFMEVSGILISMEATQTTFPVIDNAQAYLLFAFDGFDGDDLFLQAEMMYPILEESGAIDILPSPNSDVAQQWWKVRRAIGETVKQHSIYKEEDTVVPRFSLPQLLTKVKEIGNEYGFQSVCYGHAGDGNLHVNILKNDLSDEYWNNEIPKAIRKIFQACKSLGGTISGEHGIGYSQKQYLDEVFSLEHRRLMKGIKDVFDPNGILNPGKWVDDSF
jgi:glycolate oxidase